MASSSTGDDADAPLLILKLSERAPPLVRDVFEEKGFREHDEGVDGEHHWHLHWKAGRFKPSEYEVASKLRKWVAHAERWAKSAEAPAWSRGADGVWRSSAGEERKELGALRWAACASAWPRSPPSSPTRPATASSPRARASPPSRSSTCRQTRRAPPRMRRAETSGAA